MRRRKLLVALAGLAVVVVAAAAILRNPGPQRPVTSIPRASFSRLKVGMTPSEVAAILGPPGDNRTMETEIMTALPHEDRFGTPQASVRSQRWLSDTANVFVSFDKSGKACAGLYCPARPSRESSLSLFLKQAKRQWQGWFP
jgi:hypothetical protein